MNPDDAFERCLAALYEAALDDTRWPAASALIEEAVGTGGSALNVGEGFDGDARITFSRYLERGQSRADRAREYAEVYHRHDEALPRLRLLPHGQRVHVPDLYTEDELKTSPVYNEAFRRWRSHEGLYVRFDGPAGSRIVWTVANPVGGDGWESARLRLHEGLLPHVHRAVVIRQALAAADALGSGVAGLLDSERIGVVQLDRGGRVLAANGPALGILRRGDGLIDRDGALDAVLPADRSRLQRLIETDVAGFVAGSGKTGVRGPVVSREGALVEKAFLAGMVSGVGQGVAQAFQPQAVATGTGAAVANTGLGDIGRAGLGAGASSAGQKVADYMIRRAEQYQPVVQLQAGTKVTLVFLEGARIDGRAPVQTAQQGK